MLLPQEKINSDADFKAVCAMIHKDFERVAEYIRENIYLSEIVSQLTAAGKRESLVHKYNNVSEIVNIINNAVKETAPTINI
ncbi:hypothetical protein CH513_15430 [Salmonella enterica subsp. enterica serovar Infantis]|nr:hypothetical protein [Salmonella enterica subsp. enterica serovar Infantis]